MSFGLFNNNNQNKNQNSGTGNSLFGGLASSGSSLLGSTSQPQQQSNMFSLGLNAGGSQPVQQSGISLFGANSTGISVSNSQSLFGGNKLGGSLIGTTSLAPTTPTTSLFGSQSIPASSNSLFGGASTSTTSLFGSTSAPQVTNALSNNAFSLTPKSTVTSGTSLFSSSGQSPFTSLLGGNTVSTPATSTTGQGMFPSLNLSNPSTLNPIISTPQTSTAPALGLQPKLGTSLFGGTSIPISSTSITPSTNPTTIPSIFGTLTQQPVGGLPTPQPGLSLFNTATSAPSTTIGTTSSSGMFSMSSLPKLGGGITGLGSLAPPSSTITTTTATTTTSTSGFSNLSIATSSFPSLSTPSTSVSLIPQPSLSLSMSSSTSVPLSISLTKPLITSATLPSSIPSTSNTNLGVSGLSTGTVSNSGTSSESTSSAASSSTTASDSLDSMKTYKDLSNHLNQWTQELEEKERLFVKQASMIAQWDQILMENGNEIMGLLDGIESAKSDYEIMSKELDTLVQEQNKLQATLDNAEKELRSLTLSNDLDENDRKRQSLFEMSNEIDKEISQLSGQVKEVIEFVNEKNQATSHTNVTVSDPTSQVIKILNQHMNILQTISENTESLEQKLCGLDEKIKSLM